VCEFGLRIVDQASRKMKIDELKKLKLAEQVQRFGLQGAVDTAESAKTYGDIIRIGCKVLTGEDIVGFGANQIRPWELTSQGMWQHVERDGGRLIDEVSTYLIDTVFPSKYPETRAGDGTLSSRGLAAVPRLQREFDLVAKDCLRASNMMVQQALQRVAPDAFGYSSHQIKPWETQRLHMWDEPGLFRKAAIYYAAEVGIGVLDRTTLRYELPKDQFDSWI
jgi:hypothetical protein